MGVEYTHYITVTELRRVGTVSDAVRIHELLERLGLAASRPQLAESRAGLLHTLAVPLDRQLNLQNLVLTYPFVRSAPTIPRLMGPSAYPGIPDDQRYIQHIRVTVGGDFHVHPGDESFFFEVAQPPMERGAPVQPYSKGDVFPATSDTEPPVIRSELCNEAASALLPPDFPGAWRICIELFCGKDLPAFFQDSYRMPGRELVDGLRAALDTNLSEIGSISP